LIITSAIKHLVIIRSNKGHGVIPGALFNLPFKIKSRALIAEILPEKVSETENKISSGT
jgi:hypothetical protein